MLDALRHSRASVLAPVSVPGAPVVVPTMEAPPVSTPPVVTEPPVELPRAVADAVAMYAFGDPVEAAANYQRAVTLTKAGRPAADIVREIRMGASVEAFI